jgi:LmbE family N-acetylglucosaminyl deacetylase
MYKFFTLSIAVVFSFATAAQTPKTYTSSEILLQLKKLNVLGSVLYIAAHPDDENTRLLAYLANEKLYRTGYLSLTRGDGGQNLIGDEQGIDLGLIRTQELLSARRIDGAEQFFSRAYDFGFCKSPEEALATWGHEKILSDAVWVIRKFRPDVIICRFPEDARAGHGHHAASGIIAREAFDAAADSTKFPEQLKQGVTVWQAKRMLWNTFNFGGTSTQNESQFKVDVGMYNPLLGKSYGEIAALSRSQHKSQGFGVPAQRGSVIEYFETIKGEKPVNDLMDGVDVSWEKINQRSIEDSIKTIIQKYDMQNPAASLKSLVSLYETVQKLADNYWKEQKLEELKSAIENCSGLYMEATAAKQYAVQGDSLKISLTAVNRLGVDVSDVEVIIFEKYRLDQLVKNKNIVLPVAVFIPALTNASQPYWLEKKMEKGSFVVEDQQQIGKPESDQLHVTFKITLEGQKFSYSKPLKYKYTDPIKGEIYQPVSIIPYVEIKPEKDIYFLKDKDSLHIGIILSGKINDEGDFGIGTFISDIPNGEEKSNEEIRTDFKNLEKDKIKFIEVKSKNTNWKNATKYIAAGGMNLHSERVDFFTCSRIINYDHIPSIIYQKPFETKAINFDLKTAGRTVGYIPGAGDKVPQALEQMGYKVTMLKETDITTNNLKQFDAVITGIRAYNTNDWMGNVYDALMQYVKDGGVLLTQYNTSNFVSNVKSKMGPYNFSISRTRITDETAKVNFLLPNHPALNYPNKITDKDFEGWVQERSIYHAEKIDSNYQRILSMKDVGETDQQDGSLIVANYGKGKFVYTGLVFFRQLPAGVPGAYRLFANLIAAPASPKSPPKERTSKTPKIKSSKPGGKKNSQ